MINKLSTKIHSINVKNGFYESDRNIGEMLALIHSEVSEALEADRSGKHYSCDPDYSELSAINRLNCDELFKKQFTEAVKDTFEDELADVMIRVMDLAAYKGIDLEKHIEAKMRYNSLREYKHGKKY